MKRSALSRKKRMRQKPVNRRWDEARAKLSDEPCCRSCLLRVPLEAAHTIGRRYQDEHRVGPRGKSYLWVNPASVIGLCSMCHYLFDQRQISILTLLSFSELMNAARACKKWGLDCRRRLTGNREYTKASGLSKGDSVNE